jgi:hypothetical protein
MKTNLIILLAVCMNLVVFISCTKHPPIYYDDEKYDLLLNYPSVSSPGAPTTVIATFFEKASLPALVQWYANDYPFPQSLRQNNIVNSPNDATYIFSFPDLPEETYYFIRCSVFLADGTIIIEKTIKIQSIK